MWCNNDFATLYNDNWTLYLEIPGVQGLLCTWTLKWSEKEKQENICALISALEKTCRASKPQTPENQLFTCRLDGSCYNQFISLIPTWCNCAMDTNQNIGTSDHCTSFSSISLFSCWQMSKAVWCHGSWPSEYNSFKLQVQESYLGRLCIPNKQHPAWQLLSSAC